MKTINTNNLMNNLNGKMNYSADHPFTAMNGVNGSHHSEYKVIGINRFFLMISRANTDILRQCPQSDVNKYVVLGIILLLMSVFNLFSFTHFFSMCGLGDWISFSIAILLSVLIFYIDQAFIVSAISNPLDGSWNKFRKNFLRLIFSLAISIVIPVPVKILIFEDAIQKAYNRDKLIISDSLNNKKFSTPEDEEYFNDLKIRLKEMEHQIAQKSKRHDSLNEAFQHPSCRYSYEDKYGNKKFGLTFKGKNILSEIEHVKKERSSLEEERDSLKSKLATLQIFKINQTKTLRESSDSLLNENAFSFSMKYKYYNKVTDFYVDGKFPFIHGDYLIFCFVLSLIFGFIDFMPVFVKVFMFNGTYELLQFKNYQTARLNTEHEVNMLSERIKNETSTLMNKIRHENEMDAMKKNHEKELQKIKLDYEKALLLLQTKDNLNEALYILSDLSDKLRKLYNDEQVTVNSKILSNL